MREESGSGSQEAALPYLRSPLKMFRKSMRPPAEPSTFRYSTPDIAGGANQKEQALEITECPFANLP
jgi:hypothetical protein